MTSALMGFYHLTAWPFSRRKRLENGLYSARCVTREPISA